MNQKNFPFMFLDVETTGHDPLRRITAPVQNLRVTDFYSFPQTYLIPWHEIIEIGALIADPVDYTILGEFEQKIKPEHPERCLPDLVNHYPKRAAAGEWNNALTLAQGLCLLFVWCRRIVPDGVLVSCGQNFFFDWSFMTVAFAQCDMDENFWRKSLHYTHFDTRSMAIQALWEPGTPYDPKAYSLRADQLAGRLGIPPEPYPHVTLNGARQSFAVFKRLTELKQKRLAVVEA